MAEQIINGVSKEMLVKLRVKAIDFALVNGISMRPSSNTEDQDKVVHAPFTLFPSNVPRYLLQEATQLMVHFNKLMHRVALDHEFLQDAYKHVIENDEFSRRLWEIYMNVKDDPKAQSVHLGLFRNDFMINCIQNGDKETVELKQIEFNTIASSFGGLVSQQGKLHRYILDCLQKEYTESQLPRNRPVEGLAAGLVKAWDIYNNKNAVIVFLVSQNERNCMDQRHLEFEIYNQRKNITVIRKTFEDLITSGILTKDRKFVIDNDEIGVVYFRDGYDVSSYTSDKVWDARLKLEQSLCIKCPSIQYHLAGAKKIQQVLAKPGVLKRFITDENIISSIQSMFAGQYSLDMDEAGDKAVEMAIKSPERFVLKPQREGGGHNLYDDELKAFLEKNRGSPDRAGYILMEKILPKPQINYLIKSGVSFVQSDCVSEIGIYGCHIGTKTEELYNTVCGHLLRTKTADTKEGGVCAGFAGIDTPYIID